MQLKKQAWSLGCTWGLIVRIRHLIAISSRTNGEISRTRNQKLPGCTPIFQRLGVRARPNERGKWGYVNEKQELVIPYEYDMAGSFGSTGVDGYAWVKFDLDKENKSRSQALAFGSAMIIDTQGKMVSKVYGFMLVGSVDSYGVTLVNTGRKFKGTPGNYTYALDGYWGGIDGRGKEIIPCVYEFLIPTDISQIFLVRKDGKWGAMDNTGKILVPLTYKGVIHNGFSSFLDVDGKEEFEAQKEVNPEQFVFVADDGTFSVPKLRIK